MVKAALSALLMLCAATSAAAPLTLQQAITQAVERDPSLAAAGVRVREARAAYTAAEGALDLVGELNLDLSTQRQTVGAPERRVLDTTQGTFNVGLRQPLVWGTQISVGWAHIYTETDNPFRSCVPGEASGLCFESRLQLVVWQPLWRGRGRAVQAQATEQAVAEGAVARRAQQAAASAVVDATITTFVELAYAQREAEIRQQAVALAETQWAVSKARVVAGRLAEAELPVVEQAVAERSRALFAAQQALADGRAALQAQIGPVQAVVLPEPTPWLGGDAAAAAAAARAQHPDLAVLDAQLDAQRVALVGLKDATDPQLDLQITAAQTGLDAAELGAAISALPSNDSHYYGAELRFAFPFANRSAEGRLKGAQLALERVALEREARARAVSTQAASARRRLETASHGARLARRVVALSQRTVVAEQRRFELGRTTNLAVLQVQQNAAEAELAVARADADRLLAEAALRRLTGALLSAHAVEITSP